MIRNLLINARIARLKTRVMVEKHLMPGDKLSNPEMTIELYNLRREREGEFTTVDYNEVAE